MVSKLVFLSKALLLALVIMLLGRLSLLAFDSADFLPLGFIDFLKLFFGGLQFDILVTFQINAFFIILTLINVSKKYQKLKQIVANYYFIIINATSLIINLSDAANFRYSGKRSSFYFIKANVSEDSFLPLLTKYLYDSWYLLLVAIVIIYLFYKLLTLLSIPDDVTRKSFYHKTVYSLILLVITVTFLAGLKKIDMNPADAARYAKSQHIPLVINSSFTVLSSLKDLPEDEFNYFSKEECKSLFNPAHPASHQEFKKWNVVIIILESIGEEYTGFSLAKNFSSTPFLDSLARNGLTFTNSYANAHRSIEGIPAVVASIPNVSESAFITSDYSNNKVTSIANTLKKQGYYSAFFHGGANGSMGFDKFSQQSGFDTYFGRNEYPDQKDFDGHWGIFDEPFLQFMAKKITAFKQPFTVCEFTLSSHHPYGLPKAYKNKFKGNEFQQSISYTDNALRTFFNEAKKQDWYQNTLFVITSDHTSSPVSSRYRTDEGTFRIPMLFYKENEPSLHAKRLEATAQHIDILPTVLGLLNYPESFFSFGKNAIRSNENSGAILYQNYLYQYVDMNSNVQYDGKKPVAYYKREDIFCKQNVLKNLPANEMNFLKAWLQQYHEVIKSNKMN